MNYYFSCGFKKNKNWLGPFFFLPSQNPILAGVTHNISACSTPTISIG
jgi:hypothetical protein